VDDYVELSNINVQHENTISFWAKRNELSPWNTFISFGSDGCTPNTEFTIGFMNNGFTLVVGCSWGAVDNLVDDTNWHYYSILVKPTVQQSIVYQDGIQYSFNVFGTNTGNYSVPVLNNGIFYLGYNIVSNNGYLFGKLDDLAIWNTTLTQEQIQSNMTTPPTGDEDGLIGYWNFDEGTGSTVTDQTSNGNDGAITGPSWSNDVPYSHTLSGTPGPLDGGLHNVILSANDGNGGVITQSFTVAVSVTHLDIDGTSGFRILSSPISGAVYSDLLDELWTQGAVGSDHEGADPNIWTYNDGWNPDIRVSTFMVRAHCSLGP
jgi:hypothetical protein